MRRETGATRNSETPIAPPRRSAQAMISAFRQSIARRNVPVINLEVYQDGTASPASLEQFRQIRAALIP